MPSVIAIEAKPVEFEGVDTGFLHLYLVKIVTDAQGRIVSEKVIRGTDGSNGDLETLANVDLASSPDRRGSDTPQERHQTLLNLGGRNADDVWKIMVQHANNIERADLSYSIDINQELPGPDLNSNSVVASVLHSAAIDWTDSLPNSVSRSDVPLFGQLQHMKVDDVLRGDPRRDHIMGGVGNDAIYGEEGNDRLYGESGDDRLWGDSGDDYFSGRSGNDRLSGGSGVDVMHGGAGKDAFVFQRMADERPDVIRDFSVADDIIWLENKAFTALGSAGGLRSSAFWAGNEAHDANDRVIYNRNDGILYYDPDVTGAAEQIAVAKLTAGLRMTNEDFRII